MSLEKFLINQMEQLKITKPVVLTGFILVFGRKKALKHSD
jgi:hypothetical protein